MTPPPAHHIIVTDDDQVFRELICLVLEEAGYIVHTAREGSEALKLYAEYPGSLVLLDIYMPGMEGMECLLAFKRLHPDACIVVMSGVNALADKTWSNMAVRFGAKAVLPKPFSSQTLLGVLNNLLQ